MTQNYGLKRKDFFLYRTAGYFSVTKKRFNRKIMTENFVDKKTISNFAARKLII
jgi:hypothetical protein